MSALDVYNVHTVQGGHRAQAAQSDLAAMLVLGGEGALPCRGVWPVTTGPAAAVLGVSPAKLRRWINEKRFDHIDGMSWDHGPGYERKRLFTRAWVEAVAAE